MFRTPAAATTQKRWIGTPSGNRKWATANGKRGAAMQRRWRLPKGVLRERFAIKKRRFPPRPCSGIDSAVAGPWQHADVNEEKAANSVLLRWTEGSRDGVAYRDMTAMHPADSTDDRAAVSPARRQAFWLVSSGPAKECTFRDFAALGHHLGRSRGRRAAAPAEFISRSAVSELIAKCGRLGRPHPACSLCWQAAPRLRRRAIETRQSRRQTARLGSRRGGAPAPER